jgi:hypothetical protein
MRCEHSCAVSIRRFTSVLAVCPTPASCTQCHPDPHLQAGPAASKDASASASERMPLQPAGLKPGQGQGGEDRHAHETSREAGRARRGGTGASPPAAEWHAALPSVCRSAALPAPFVLRSYRVPIAFLSRSYRVPIACRGPVCSPLGAVLTPQQSCTEPEWPSRASPARPSSAPASFQTRCTLPHCRPRTDRCTDGPRRRFECIPFVALFNAARLGVCRTRKATGTLGWASGKRGLRCWGCGGRRRRRVCVHACRTARRSRRTSRSRPPAASRPAERRATGRSVRIGAAGHVVTARSAAMRPAPIAANCRERARVGRRCAGRSSPSARKLGMLTMG